MTTEQNRTEQNRTECYGAIDKYILFGGGSLLIFTAKRLKGLGLQVFVVTSERHSKEIILVGSVENTLLGWLDNEQIECIVSKDITTDNKVIGSISDSTIGLSFGAAWIFKKEFINRFHGNLLNLHGARLPQNRGGGGFSWRIMRGERIGISLIHKIDPRVDTGDIVFFKDYIYPINCRTPLDYQKYSIDKYKKLLDTFFDKVRNSESFNISTQQEYFSSYWPRLSTDTHGFIDWNWQLTDIEKFVCAFDEPYAGASTFIGDNHVRLKECYSWSDDGIFHPFQKGIIYRKNNDSVFVATEHGSLIVNRVLDEQAKDIKQQLRVGDRFYTPKKLIENAVQYRAIYTPTGLKKF